MSTGPRLKTRWIGCGALTTTLPSQQAKAALVATMAGMSIVAREWLFLAIITAPQRWLHLVNALVLVADSSPP
jgi:hypothetical protein